MQALILAGGEGTRLRPLTATIPKPVVPLAGRPHVAYVIDWLERHGVDEVVMSCGHLAEGVRDALEDTTGPSLAFAEEPDARGTAGAIRFAADQGLLGDRFLVLNGDILCDLDLTALLAQHERTGARATIALHPVEDPTNYGLVRRGEDGAISEFLEKPDADEIDTDEVNAGAYVLERSVLDLIPPDKSVSIEREVFPRLVGDGLYGRRLDGYWIDIGTPDRYLQANWDILERRVDTVISERLDSSGNLVDDGAEVGEAELSAPAMVGAGATVSSGASVGPRAVIGTGSAIGDGAGIRESVLLEGCRVGEGATLNGVILSPQAEVAPNARIEPGVVIARGERVGEELSA
jgi:mannose-1-phosphate guanylyltransferase